MGKARQSREELLEKKRIAERKRKAKLKNNPEEHEKLKKEDRDRYRKNKAEKKILPIAEFSSRKRKIIRERNRINSKRYRQRKKNSARITENEELIHIVNDSTGIEVQDPLAESSSPIQFQLRSSSLRPRIEDPKSPSVHVSRPQQSITKRRTERANTFSPFLNLRDLSMRGTSQQPDLQRQPDDMTINDSLQQPLVSSSSKLTTLSSHNATTTPVAHSSRPRDRIARRQSSVSSSSVLSSPSSDVSVTSISAAKRNIQISETSTGKARSLSARKFKYKMGKEMNILHKRIQELTQLNNKYRKQVFRLKTYVSTNTSKTGTDSDESCNIAMSKKKIPTTHLKNVINKKQLEETIHNFYLDDDNSRICPGKKECITKGKVRKQKRYLSESILNLYKKFKKMHPNYIVSYSHFWKLKPFWVIIPNMRIRDTCMCVKHDNIQLIISSLKRNCILTENTSRDVLNSLCCNAMDPKCLFRQCNVCINSKLHYNEFVNANEISYWSWKTEKKPYVKNGQTKFASQTAKVKICAPPKDVINELEKMLPPFLKHCGIIVSQSAHIKKIKNKLKENEAVVHCDFSENYGLKYANEIQAIHFGGSRQQITLHTVVLYFRSNGNLKTQALCTLSSCLRHDAVSIWEHLMPVLRFIEENCPEVDTFHFLSDSPSGQYRNCKMFYVISKLHWYFPSLRLVTWNYSESGHGKGAPDGVGGVLKRSADQIVARGRDIADLETLLSEPQNNN